MHTAGLPWLSASTLLAALCALLPPASAQSGRWDHAFSQSGHWDQAFRHTGSQALGQTSPLPASGYFSANPQLSLFDSSRFVSRGFGFGDPGLPWCGGVCSPCPLVIQTPPLPLWRTPWGSTGVLYPTIPLAGSPWPDLIVVDPWLCNPLVSVSCSSVWGAGPCGGGFLFPVIQSFSFQSIHVQSGPLQMPGPLRTSGVLRPAAAPPVALQAHSLPPAFDPADPRLLNFTAPPRGQFAAAPVARDQPLPGVTAQPIPEPLNAPADPDAKARKVVADGGIVLRGKRKLANRDRGN
ncbi:MAG: hypothetical protein ACKO2P_06155 [Planctomycetota bacterium]